MNKNNKTLVIAAISCFFIFLWSLISPENFRSFFEWFTLQTLDLFGDYYLYFGFGAVILLLLIAVLPSGKKQLGTGKPEYNFYSWVAMLFSTGMGPGLMLRAVQEPVNYYLNPPLETTYDPASYALAYTFFHWGLTPWAFYSLFGLAVAFAVHVRRKKLLPSAVIVNHEPTAIGIDTLIILCTIFGVISSVGLGSRQLLEGLNFVTTGSYPASRAILIVLFIVFVSIFSARSGLGKSIKYISTLNISLSLALLFFVLFNSSLSSYFSTFFGALIIYLKDFIPMSLNLGKHQMDRAFLLDWTYFYWAFWLAWVPFTGVFIARISKGRTIRTFVLGTLIAPVTGTFFWFTAFGERAIHGGLTRAELSGLYGSVYSAIFQFFNGLPMATLINPISLLLLFTFLITSIDSAIYVLSMFSDNGSEEPDQKHRLVWGLVLGGLTATLLLAGKGELLEATSHLLITIALPFSFIYLWFIIHFVRELYKPD